MSKYEPLKHYLMGRREAEIPMTFREVEAILGFALPSSARSHAAWWSNNVGTHVNAAAWREAGWKTSRVNLGAERVTFVREVAGDGVEDSASRFVHRTSKAALAPSAITLRPQELSQASLRMIDDYAEEAGLDRAGAIAALLDRVALSRRRELLATLPVATMPAGHDSTAMIREDRDRR